MYGNTYFNMLWLAMKLYKCYQYIELCNSVMEFHTYFFMDLHIDLYKSSYIHKSNYGTLELE